MLFGIRELNYVDSFKMHVIDNHLYDQSEMSAEEMLDEYIDREDKSIIDMMDNIARCSSQRDNRNKLSYENDFNFLGSKINDYNNQLQYKLNQTAPKQNSNFQSHSWLNKNNRDNIDSCDENNKSKSVSFSEFFNKGKSKSKQKMETMKTENLLSSLNLNSINAKRFDDYNINDYLPQKTPNGVFEWRAPTNFQNHSQNQELSEKCCSCNKNISRTASDYNIKSPSSFNQRKDQYEKKASNNRNNRFNYQENRSDSLDSNDTLDLCRDTEEDNYVQKRNENKADFSRYISQVSLQFLHDQKPFVNNDCKATVKPANLPNNLFQSPKFHNKNPNENINSTIVSKSTLSGKQRRSKSKITKVVSRKKFREDDAIENLNPNETQSASNIGNIHGNNLRESRQNCNSVERQLYPKFIIGSSNFNTLEENQNNTLSKDDLGKEKEINQNLATKHWLNKNYNVFLSPNLSETKHFISHQTEINSHLMDEMSNDKYQNHIDLLDSRINQINKNNEERNQINHLNRVNDVHKQSMERLANNQKLLKDLEAIESQRLSQWSKGQYGNHEADDQNPYFDTNKQEKCNLEQYATSNFHGSSGIYYNTSSNSNHPEKIESHNNSFGIKNEKITPSEQIQKFVSHSSTYESNNGMYELKKLQALKELDDIIASSEDELFGIKNQIAQLKSTGEIKIDQVYPQAHNMYLDSDCSNSDNKLYKK